MMPEVGMEVEAANNGGGALEPGGAARPAAVSLLRYSPALVVFIIAITDVGRWADPDLWGHIRFGQLALTLGHAPVRNPYSYSAPGYLWRDPEWLAEALLALAYDTFGIVGLKLMKFAATAVTVLLMALAAAESRASVRIQLVVLTMAGVALIPMMQFRPQLFTFMLLSALIAAARARQFSSARRFDLARAPDFRAVGEHPRRRGRRVCGDGALRGSSRARGSRGRTRPAHVAPSGRRHAGLRGRDAGQSIRLRKLARG